MRACNYRHRVTLQSATNSTADSYGATSLVWSDVATGIPAEVRMIGETEGNRGEQVQGDATVMVTMRYRSDVDQESRFLFGTRYLYVVGVLPDVRNRELVCNCGEKRT